MGFFNVTRKYDQDPVVDDALENNALETKKRKASENLLVCRKGIVNK